MKSKLLYEKISNIEFAEIDHRDRPDYADVIIVSADYDEQPMTDEQINNDADFVHEKLLDYLC